MTFSTRARVSGATSGLPLSTLDTVGTDTPASAAMDAMDEVPLLAPGSSDVLMLTPVRASTASKLSVFEPMTFDDQ
ncbi:hypothetical protein GCM10010185_29780 [Saccharothrix coeruleofusca]|uniref:Uncharacterized protein n=1 Tax=Saccharothrix coeruleofusca TaxID=33919 RepID=A0A918EET7_9PSEU|nr:hypothetical protein GCM10010185_29780 [Saccharothrix coeruleofusca]